MSYTTYYTFRHGTSVSILGGTSNDRVLAAGGGPGANQNAQTFDPYLNSWSAALPMNVARDRFTLTTLNDGNALAVGGLGTYSALFATELYSY